MSGFERDLRTAFTWPLTLLVVLFPITLITSAASRLEYVFCPQGSDNTGNVSVAGWPGAADARNSLCRLTSHQYWFALGRQTV
jgi:hypothetical protein